ncbi:MAG: ribosome recycling factor [Planctomycetota bacterium]|jgi:ribosome recycling factor
MAKDYDTILMECEEAMQKVSDHLRSEFVGISAGRANPAMVENVKFDYYGALTPLKQAGQINCPDATTITIKPFDVSQIKVINKAITDANLGFNPSDDGGTILIKLPPMTEENRTRLAKQIKEMAEKSKVAVRNARHDAMKANDASQKEGILTEDDHAGLKKDVQKLTDRFNKELDDILEKKTKDVMTV